MIPMAMKPRPKSGRERLEEKLAGDKRFRMLDAHIKRYQMRQDALIEVLHHAQEIFGMIDEDLMLFIAEELGLPYSRVFGVVTFYHFFNLKPQGAHACVVCMGTACYVKGADRIVNALRQTAGVEPGHTTEDGKVSIATARCIGACGIAPAVVYDGEVAARQTPEDATQIVKGWMQDGS